MHVAVLGGGLTGLSSAFYLARRYPSARITLLEKAPRLGGWVRSERVTVKTAAGEASVLLEAGPRTLRPGALAVLELIKLLNLTSSLLTVPRTAPAARNRFLHLPGTHGLLCVPASFPALFTSPLSRVLVPAVLRDVIGRANTPDPHEHSSTTDESVESFLARRFGPEFARTFGSALVHGIYAADARTLSMRAAFPTLLELAARGHGSVVRGALMGAFGRREKSMAESGYELGKVQALMEGVSVYSFKEGMETLVHALEEDLARRENVCVVKGHSAVMLRKGADEAFKITTSSGMTLASSHLISTLPLPALDAILQKSSTSSLSTSTALPPLPHIAPTRASSVTAVNLVFPADRPLHPPGFGYLVPRSCAGYAFTPSTSESPNPLGILGTVFDSCALGAQDTGAPVAKLTVMLGGPHPRPDLAAPAFAHALLAELARHLGARVPLPAPLLMRTHVLAGCIPTPEVGHEARMARMREEVARHWGHAEVLGAGVGGVSVGACIEMGRGAGQGWTG